MVRRLAEKSWRRVALLGYRMEKGLTNFDNPMKDFFSL